MLCVQHHVVPSLQKCVCWCAEQSASGLQPAGLAAHTVLVPSDALARVGGGYSHWFPDAFSSCNAGAVKWSCCVALFCHVPCMFLTFCAIFYMFGSQFLCNMVTGNENTQAELWQSYFPAFFLELFTIAEPRTCEFGAALLYNCFCQSTTRRDSLRGCLSVVGAMLGRQLGHREHPREEDLQVTECDFFLVCFQGFVFVFLSLFCSNASVH